MSFMGFPIEDWLTLVSIISALLVAFGAAANYFIFRPQKESNKQLQKLIDEVRHMVENTNKEAKHEHRTFEKRLDRHAEKLTDHGARIKLLEGKK